MTNWQLGMTLLVNPPKSLDFRAINHSATLRKQAREKEKYLKYCEENGKPPPKPRKPMDMSPEAVRIRERDRLSKQARRGVGRGRRR